MNKIDIKKNYFNFALIGGILLYLILFVLKDLIFSFANIEYKSFLPIDIIYQVLIISLSLIYILVNKDKQNSKEILINLLIGFLSICIYFILSSIEVYALSFFNITSNSSQIVKSISLIICSIIIMLLLIIVNKKSLKKDIQDIRKNHKKYFSKYIKYWFFAVLVMMFSNVIIGIISNGGIANNEESIRETFKIAPIYIYFSTIIFAPFVEEIVFRRSLKNIIPSKWAFIITSGIIFGGLHVISSITSLTDVLYIIPYSCCGLAFAYILYETDNVLVSTGLHFLHNGVMMALETLLLLLGAL
ncbi:MAG: CPBP family intramembrane metalloprotease [Clostridium sp.]|nr:CPBP family intramembrane metalloprotease [Clostridium sp.]MCM1444617.1 CPBP family intramembrane metalloprotease [Candidatus Amulumruptor caecigallinarius]